MKKRFKLTCVLLLVFCMLGLLCGCTKETVFTNIQKNLEVYDEIDSYYQTGINSWESYIKGEIKYSELADQVGRTQNNIDKCEPLIASDALKESSLADSKLGESVLIGEYIQTLKDAYLNSLTFFSNFPALNLDSYTQKDLLSLVEIYRGINQADRDLIWYEVNNYLIEYSDSAEVKSLRESAKKTSTFSELSDQWSTDKQEVAALINMRLDKQEKMNESLELFTGDIALDVDALSSDYENYKNALIEHLMTKYGLTEELATQYFELYQLKQDLEDQKEIARQKFAPSSENTSGELIGKAARFAGIKLYDEAIACVDIFLEKDEDPDYPKICGEALRAFYEDIPGTGINYGILVVKSESDYYQDGDILLTINNKQLTDLESYQALEEEKKAGYTTNLLRLNNNGKLEAVEVKVPANTDNNFSAKFVFD